MPGTPKTPQQSAPEAKSTVDLDKLEAKLARHNKDAERLAEVMRQKPKKS